MRHIMIGMCASAESPLPVRIATIPWPLPRALPGPNLSDAGGFAEFPPARILLTSAVTFWTGISGCENRIAKLVAREEKKERG